MNTFRYYLIKCKDIKHNLDYANHLFYWILRSQFISYMTRSSLIIEKILFKRTSLSSVWGLRGGWNKDTFLLEIKMWQIKAARPDQ